MIRRAFGVGAADERVVRHRGAGVGIDADDRAVEADRVAGVVADVLRAQRAALGRRRAERVPTATADRRTGSRASRRRRPAVLAVVDVVEARAVAAAGVERAVGPERDRADRVARVDCWHQSSTRTCSAPSHGVAASPVEPRQAAADDAAVGRRARAASGSVVVAPATTRGGPASPRMWLYV